MGEFEGKVVLITGASAGIGAATALRFAEKGASLALTGRNVEKLNAICKECSTKGAKDVLPIIAEFGNLDDVKNVAEKTIKKFTKLDILINNAGCVQKTNLESIKMEDYDMMFDINVKSMVYMTQLVMPHLVKSKGNVVNISSIAGVRQFVNTLVYGMTKAAVDQFTKTIALEYAPKGVRVNAVNPSNVKTEITRHSMPDCKEDELNELYDKLNEVHPTGRIGLVDEVVNAILFLASEASAWTTGQCLLLDGGRSLTVSQTVTK